MVWIPFRVASEPIFEAMNQVRKTMWCRETFSLSFFSFCSMLQAMYRFVFKLFFFSTFSLCVSVSMLVYITSFSVYNLVCLPCFILISLSLFLNICFSCSSFFYQFIFLNYSLYQSLFFNLFVIIFFLFLSLLVPLLFISSSCNTSHSFGYYLFHNSSLYLLFCLCVPHSYQLFNNFLSFCQFLSFPLFISSTSLVTFFISLLFSHS